MIFARIKHFPEVYGLSYVAYQRQQNGGHPAPGYPEIFKTVQEADDRPVSLTPELESFWVRLLFEGCQNKLATDKILRAYANITSDGKGFCDRASWGNGFQSVPLSENIGADPMRMPSIIGCGMTVKVISDSMRIGGRDVHKIEVFNSLDPATLTATRRSHWWMVYNAPIGYYDPYPLGVVGTFPQLDDYPVRVPLLAHGKNYVYVESKWLDFLPFGARVPVDPYFPTKGVEMNGTAKTAAGRIKIFQTYQGLETGTYLPAATMFEWKTKQANWLQLLDGTWVNCGSTFQYATILTYPTAVVPPPVDPPPVDPPPGPAKVTHILHIDDTGKLSTDGGPFV